MYLAQVHGAERLQTPENSSLARFGRRSDRIWIGFWSIDVSRKFRFLTARDPFLAHLGRAGQVHFHVVTYGRTHGRTHRHTYAYIMLDRYTHRDRSRRRRKKPGFLHSQISEILTKICIPGGFLPAWPDHDFVHQNLRI